MLNKHKIEILLDDARHLQLKPALKEELCQHIKTWLQHDNRSPYNYKVKDAVFRVAGTGSLGLKRYAFLLKSLNAAGEKYMLLDMKQSAPSSLLPHLKTKQPAWQSEAERIMTIQYLMQNRPPALLSMTAFHDESYIIQEMQPVKDSINFKLIKKDYRNIFQVIDDMAILTASSQLRSTGRMGACTAEELVSYGKNKDWQEPLIAYASAYALTVQTNYREFARDYQAGLFELKKYQ